MNICGFSKVSYWHGIKGGMDVHGRILSEGLADRGHQVTIISTRHPSGRLYEKKQGVRINYLENTVFGSRRQGWQKESELKFLKLHGQKPFDIIWSQSFDGFGLANLRKKIEIPLIATIHGSIQQELKTFKTNFKSKIKYPEKMFRQFLGLFYSYFIVQKQLLQSADIIITVSQKVANDLEKWFGNRILEKCEIIHNGIDTSFFRPSCELRKTIRNRFGICPNEIMILTLGRLTSEKGHHIALEAMKHAKKLFPGVKLLIVGEGVIRKQLEGQVRRNKMERDVFFTGVVENEETVKFYNAADIFLMPTLTEEGLPFVMLEAMACGKPVIASRIGGNGEIISDGINGLIFQPGDVRELLGKITLLIEESALRDKISIAARKTIEKRFSVKRMIQSAENIFEFTLKKDISINKVFGGSK